MDGIARGKCRENPVFYAVYIEFTSSLRAFYPSVTTGIGVRATFSSNDNEPEVHMGDKQSRIIEMNTDEKQGKIIDVASVKPYRSAKQKRQIFVALAVVLICAVLAGGAYFLLTPRQSSYALRGYETATVEQGSLVRTTQASGTVGLPVQMSVPSPEDGYAAGVYVSEGDEVVPGQTLARISVPDLQENLDDLQTSLEDAERSYKITVAQNKVDIDRKKREIESLSSSIATAETDRDRVKELAAINGARQSDLETAQDTLDELLSNKTEKELQRDEQAQLNTLNEQMAQSKITSLQVQIQRLKDRITDAVIKSPMKGEVLAIESSLAVAGSEVSAGASLFTIADPTSAIVELEVLEQYSTLLSVGQEVKLTVGSSVIKGNITSIGKVAQQSSDGLGATVSVKVKPKDSATTLLLGNTAVGEIDLGAKEGALLLPRGPYLTTGSQKWLYVVNGGTAVRTAVTFGGIEGNTVEILSGVSAGDQVITSGYQNFIEYERITLEKGDSK